jgi:hypothetical protein
MPVAAKRFIRKLRGGAQAHLIEGADGNYYAVKFVENPQHRRILVNELIASVFLEFLEITAPKAAIISVDAGFLEEFPEVGIQLGQTRQPVSVGWHFGSRYPADPERVAVYDFLPDRLLRSLANFAHFAGVLAFDKWMGNCDARQSIFVRAQVRQYVAGAQSLEKKFVALMIDHGYLFNGPQWSFTDSPLMGLYHRPSVYELIRSWEDFEPWLSRIENFPESVVEKAFRSVPTAWLKEDSDELERLLTVLLRRCKKVRALLTTVRKTKPELFPNWRE